MSNSSEPHLILLASYPKSGNTWMRSFFGALSNENSELKDFDELKSEWGILSSRQLIDNFLGINTSDLSEMEVQSLRYKAYEFGATLLNKDILVKTHDTPYYQGIPILPKNIVKRVILIVRNPFDMVASYANHMDCTLEKALFDINNGSNKLASNKKRLNSQVAQFMGSWSDFINVWKNTFSDRLTIVRYEDMLNNGLETFRNVVQASGMSYSDEEIMEAIEATQFEKLKHIESTKGFKEKSPNTKQFFRQGKAGNWRNEITMEMADQIIDRHFYTLLELKYVDSNRNILV